MTIRLPADPRVLSGHRQAARGGLATALPKFLRRALGPLYGNPAAVTLHWQARFEIDCLRAVRNAIDKARPAQSGADHASLAQPVPYAQLHGETGEGFEAVRRRYDLPASVQVALALGFAIPILAIVIMLHGGTG